MRTVRWGLAVALTAGLLLTGTTAAGARPAGGEAHGVPLHGIDLERATVLDLQRAMANRRLNAVALTAFYLHRIRALNPRLHAVIETNPDAVREAARSDAHRR